MAATLMLQAGKSRIFVDVEEGAPGGGTNQKVSANPDSQSFERVAQSLKDVAEVIEKQLALLAKPPSEVALSMSAKITGSAELWIVKSGAEAQLQITLKWSNP
jgi:hypothetical protein